MYKWFFIQYPELTARLNGKHVEVWKRATGKGKVHTETAISVIKHEAVGGPGFSPTASEETLLRQKEGEGTHANGNQGHRAAQDLEAQENTCISHHGKLLMVWWLCFVPEPTSSLSSTDLVLPYQNINHLGSDWIAFFLVGGAVPAWIVDRRSRLAACGSASFF